MIAEKLNISHMWVFNIAKKYELKFKKKIEKEKITPSIAEKRKNFALKYKDEKLNNIRFADERYFPLFRNTKGKWCHKNEQAIIRKLNPNYSLMIWGCIGINVKSEIAICEQGFKINSQT